MKLIVDNMANLATHCQANDVWYSMYDAYQNKFSYGAG